MLDRAALRRAIRGCELVFHTAGMVAPSRWTRSGSVNALGPRLAVEAAAAEGVSRVVLTGERGGIGPVEPGETGDEDDGLPRRGAGPHVRRRQARGRVGGPGRRRAAGDRGGGREPVATCWAAGRPVVPPGETSTRTIGNYLRGRLPAVVDGEINIVDVRDVASGHLPRPPTGSPGERYILGGHDVGWVELIERVAELSDVHHPFLVIPPEMAGPARLAERIGLPGLISSEALVLMAQNWRYSSAKARSELGFRARSLDSTLRDTVAWYRELMDAGALDGRRPVAAVAGRRRRAARPSGRPARRPAAGRALDGPAVRLARLMTRFFARDEYFMRLALREAERALEHDDVPVGCVVAAGGEVVAAAPNERELRGDPTAHCEILALREAARALGSLAARRRGALRDAGALRDVRRGDRAGARAAGGVGRGRPQGGRRRQRARRARRAEAEPPPRGGRRAAGRGVGGAAAEFFASRR